MEVKLGAGEAERSDVKLESHSESEGVIIDELMRNGPLRGQEHPLRRNKRLSRSTRTSRIHQQQWGSMGGSPKSEVALRFLVDFFWQFSQKISRKIGTLYRGQNEA